MQSASWVNTIRLQSLHINVKLWSVLLGTSCSLSDSFMFEINLFSSYCLMLMYLLLAFPALKKRLKLFSSFLKKLIFHWQAHNAQFHLMQGQLTGKRHSTLIYRPEAIDSKLNKKKCKKKKLVSLVMFILFSSHDYCISNYLLHFYFGNIHSKELKQSASNERLHCILSIERYI